ncbi:MAG: protein-L-isoaspartate(D-aspartate) O-methyltransferase [Proteobacteria bacterium]|nr:protein-L-isoaspartate(D-aspartate) O-methyltransferase [Pseudomonadota bacterium]
MSFDRALGGRPGQRLYARARARLAERLTRLGVTDPRVLQALSDVPRHQLIPEALRDRAYADTPLPIGDGQTISAPSVVALMTQALELRGGESVLEVGTGSGYQAAVLSRLAERVVSVERIPRLASAARRRLDELRVANALVYLGDGTEGRPADGPFDAIVVTAGGPEVPPPLLEQLAPGGRLVGPFGQRGTQQLLRVRRGADGVLSREVIGQCSFVDLIGTHGWAA